MDLAEWIAEWTALADYPGIYVPDVDTRIAAVIDLCAIPVDPEWPRPSPADHLWADGPYRRTDRDAPSGPERAIEHRLLGSGPQIAEGRTCCGGRVIDGINAIPLTLRPKIEADLLLYVDHGSERRLYLTEVKSASNNAWYAIVELLRQMRLFSASSHAPTYFHRKDPDTPSVLPLTGLVLAPPAYYVGRKKQGKAVEPAWQLIDAISERTALDVRLTTWEPKVPSISDLSRPDHRR